MGMTTKKIIDGLYFAVGMMLFNPATGEAKTPDELNEDDRYTYDACMGAIELLKAQEPRVMTLKEVKMLERDYYYLEAMRSPGKELREIVGAYSLECVTWPSITWARQTMGDNGYGKTWRCWTSRPDEKVRADTPWE